ncbi:MAG: dynamin family protein [Syntrophomonas sp.]
MLGQFKVGKSTFLNSLTGKALLPVGNIPVTSVITRIKFGPQERTLVTFLNNSTQEINIEDIDQYVSESGNPENHKQVLLVDIETPLLADMKDILEGYPHFDDIISKMENGLYWDLVSTNRQLLQTRGIYPENISTCDLCTSCGKDHFFSMARDKITGRMAAVISLDK